MEPIAQFSKTSFIFILIAAALAAISASTHTYFHTLSQVTFVFVLFFALLTFVKLGNALIRNSFVQWFHSILFELITFTIVKLWIHLSRLLRPNPPIGSGPPILLIHGYRVNGSIWVYLRKILSKNLPASIHVIQLGSHLDSIESFADRVLDKIGELKAPKVVLIGHSMGGLVAALAATKSSQVTDVITIGSPLSGTHLARFANGKSGHQMRLNSEFVTRLKGEILAHKTVRFYHIGTKTDQIVIPSHSALPGQNRDREFLFEDMGHVSLLFSRRVADLLIHLLGSRI